MQFAAIPAYQPDDRLIEIVCALKRQGFEIVTVDAGVAKRIPEFFRRRGSLPM